MKKRYDCPIIFWVLMSLAVLIAIVIFIFSSQDSSASDGVSIGFASFLFEKILGVEFPEYANRFIRKCAHFSIYLALGFFVRISLYKSNLKLSRSSASLASTFICFLYAATDEVHQYFVPGRSCSVFDVLLDTVGAVCGILVAYLIFERIKSKRMKNMR